MMDEEGGGEDVVIDRGIGNGATGEDDDDVVEAMDEDGDDVDEEGDEECPPVINPNQSLFDDNVSSSPRENLKYMRAKYSFFLPDYDCLIDLRGFLGYCNEKVRWGNTCLCCQRVFSTYGGTLRHMRDKRHCRILYERGVDMEEYDVFYDYSRMGIAVGGEGMDDGEGDVAIPRRGAGTRRAIGHDASIEGKEKGEEDEEDDGWEDVSDEDDASMEDDEDTDEEDDDDLYDMYEREINTRGIDITPLGELIFPDGRIVGHRCLARYYKQRYAPDRMERAAVRHARMAADDRLYNGRVVNLRHLHGGDDADVVRGRGGGRVDGGTAMGTYAALAIVGRSTSGPSMIPHGRRDGGGILVREGAGGGGGAAGGGYTSLSLYRYRAAVKKQRREDDRGRRLQHRSRMNMNKMNKKGNNIATGVVTSHMPR
jgi:pre-60S factor REI1